MRDVPRRVDPWVIGLSALRAETPAIEVVRHVPTESGERVSLGTP